VVLVDLVRVERLQHLEVGGAGLLLHQLRHEVGRERLQLVAPAQQAAQALLENCRFVASAIRPASALSTASLNAHQFGSEVGGSIEIPAPARITSR
jgi:hypothetical protein